MISALESPEVRAEYCLKKLEEAVGELEEIEPAARKSMRAKNLKRAIRYWDRMISLAAVSAANPALTQWARDNLE